MRAVSSRFLRTVRGSHTAVFRARVCEQFQSGTDPDGVEIPILDGDVMFDGGADIRGTLDLTTDGRNMWPSNTNRLLLPFGNEIFVERGIEYGNGAREWVALGYFRIQTPEQSSAPDGPIRLSAQDRMSGIIDARMMQPVQFTSAHTIRQVYETLIHDVYPYAQIKYDFDPDAVALGRHNSIVDRDRYAYLKDLTESLGKVFYWGYDGRLWVVTPPDPKAPVWDVDAGRNGVLVSMARQITREGIYNAVVATGEGADTKDPVRAVAWDANPHSPTRFGGPFGKVPRYFQSQFLTTSKQAANAAARMLATALGLPYNVNFSSVPNPALEPLDSVRIKYSVRDASEVHVLQQVTIPLSAEGTMSATTREQTNLSIGVEEYELVPQ